jgi:SMODS and SLOG-associating 2TM effector domain family 4
MENSHKPAILKQLNDSLERLETQHIAYNIELDKIVKKIKWHKLVRIILLSVTVTGFVQTLFGSNEIYKIATAIAGAISFIFLLADYNYRYEETKTMLKTQAQNLWYILERYRNIIVDIEENKLEDEKIRIIRDDLTKELHEIYSRSPIIDSKSVSAAKDRLNKKKFKLWAISKEK